MTISTDKMKKKEFEIKQEALKEEIEEIEGKLKVLNDKINKWYKKDPEMFTDYQEELLNLFWERFDLEGQVEVLKRWMEEK